jgi:hypothetical protein
MFLYTGPGVEIGMILVGRFEEQLGVYEVRLLSQLYCFLSDCVGWNGWARHHPRRLTGPLTSLVCNQVENPHVQ